MIEQTIQASTEATNKLTAAVLQLVALMASGAAPVQAAAPAAEETPAPAAEPVAPVKGAKQPGKPVPPAAKPTGAPAGKPVAGKDAKPTAKPTAKPVAPPADEASDEASGEEVTLDSLRDQGRQLIKAGKKEEMKAAIAEVGAESITTTDPEKYADLAAAFAALLGDSDGL